MSPHFCLWACSLGDVSVTQIINQNLKEVEFTDYWYSGFMVRLLTLLNGWAPTSDHLCPELIRVPPKWSMPALDNCRRPQCPWRIGKRGQDHPTRIFSFWTFNVVWLNFGQWNCCSKTQNRLSWDIWRRCLIRMKIGQWVCLSLWTSHLPTTSAPPQTTLDFQMILNLKGQKSPGSLFGGAI